MRGGGGLSEGRIQISTLNSTVTEGQTNGNVADGQTTYLSILKDKETHVLPVVHLILTEDGRGEVLDPHTGQLVSVDVVVLKTTLHGESEVRGQTGSGTAKLKFIQTHEGWQLRTYTMIATQLHHDYIMTKF